MKGKTGSGECVHVFVCFTAGERGRACGGGLMLRLWGNSGVRTQSTVFMGLNKFASV